MYDIEFILVENGSIDSSRDVFRLSSDIDQIHIKSVFVEKNLGYGYGLLKGLEAAIGDYVGWIHADMQIPPEAVVEFLNYAEEYGVDNKLFLKGVRRNRPVIDYFFTGGMTIFEALLFQKFMYDIGAIPVLFHRSLLKHFQTVPYDFSIELFAYYQAKLNNFQIVRKKVVLLERQKGTSSWNKGIKSKFKQSMRIIKDSIKIRKGEQVF